MAQREASSRGLRSSASAELARRGAEVLWGGGRVGRPVLQHPYLARQHTGNPYRHNAAAQRKRKLS